MIKQRLSHSLQCFFGSLEHLHFLRYKLLSLHQLYVKFKGDLRTICRFSYMKVYKLITLGTKFKNLLSLGGKITMFSKFITNYIEQG